MVVASDVGKFEREVWVASVVIAPADYGTTFTALRRNQDVERDIEAFRPMFDKPVDHRLELLVRVGCRCPSSSLYWMRHRQIAEHLPAGI